MKKYVNEAFPHLLHGADYNPEQWRRTPEIWDEDMRLFRLAGMNEMSMNIFSWDAVEPEEGVFDFSVLDEMINKVYENGGRVILATPTGGRPRWLAKKYPEVLRVGSDGVKRVYSHRHNHCYTSPIMREKMRIVDEKLAERYGNHPAVIAWHLSNEYGGECYCPLCIKAFQEYVRELCGGSLDELNRRYYTAVWSHKYDSFEDIEPPYSNGEACVNCLSLDWHRFVTHQTTDFMKAEIAAVRKYSSLPVTTNMMYNYGTLNYYKLGEPIDFISWDSYPDWHNDYGDRVEITHSFWHDVFRSIKKKPFLLMESAPGLVNWKPYNKLKRPGVDTAQSLAAIAHGSDSVQYFQFRKCQGNSEKWHGSVVDHVGHENTRIFHTVQETARRLSLIDGVAGSETRSEVAIIYDWETRWSLQHDSGFQKQDKKYYETVMSYYRSFWQRGISCDVVSPHSDLSGYKLVVAPMLYLVDEDIENRLERYVREGGCLYSTYITGYVDEATLCHLGGLPAGKLKDVFGIWNEEIDTYYPTDRGEVQIEGKRYAVQDYSEIVHLRGARSLGEYTKEFYAGMPAFTVNDYGKGRAYYQTFRDEDGKFHHEKLASIAEELGISTDVPVPAEGLPYGVTARKRYDEDREYLFVINYSEADVTVELGGEYVDFDGEKTETVAKISGYGCKTYYRNL